MKKFFIKLIACKILGLHSWTSSSLRGESIKQPIVNLEEELREYARMYCEHCGHESELNKRW